MPSDDRAQPNASDTEAGWQLTGTDGNGRRLSFAVGHTRLTQAYPGLTIGRHASLCDLVIDDSTVSRRHCRIGRDSEGVFVEDLNSLNATRHNGAALRPFSPVSLRDGDELAIGKAVLRLSRLQDSPTASSES